MDFCTVQTGITIPSLSLSLFWLIACHAFSLNECIYSQGEEMLKGLGLVTGYIYIILDL